MDIRYLESMLYEVQCDPIGLPEGMTFLDGEESDRLTKKIDQICTLFKQNKYKKVIPPAFEYYETFEKGSGQNVARKSFSFKDKDGKLLSLRYDMTTPIARMASMKYDEKDLPLKFFYQGDVFREQPMHVGKPRQLKQIGVELIGESDFRADVEIINLLGKAVSKLDESYRIVLGDVKIYKHILSHLKLSHSQLHALHSILNTKDMVSLKLVLQEVKGLQEYKLFLEQLPYLVGTLDQIQTKMQPFEALGFQIYMDRLQNIVNKVSSEVQKHLVIDLSLIKDFSYYTSTTLEAYIPKAGYPIANGGRYDELFQSFGKNFSAVGFAIDMSYTI